MRTPIGIVLTTIVLVAAGLATGSGATPAGAASTPHITPTPSIGLEDGQVVTILGNGFDDTPLSSGWRALQCDSGILDGPIAALMIAHCDPNGPPGVTATGGLIAIDFTVHRSIKVGEEGRPVTCGTVSGDCALLVASGTTDGEFVGAASPISFFGDHKVTVAPNTGLSDGQTVTVRGTGFVETPALNDWVVTQCSARILEAPNEINHVINECNQQEPAVFAHADAAGNVTSPLVVRKTFTAGLLAGAHTVTCGQAPNDCAVLVVQITTDGNFTGAAAPISFGKPVPTLRDCIHTFLADHEHRPFVKFRRLLVCIFIALTHKPT